jgi:hypothetical protein
MIKNTISKCLGFEIKKAFENDASQVEATK